MHCSYQRFRLFESMGKKDEHLYYLVLSAISDVRSAIKEQSSLMVLAQELNRKGDLKRAYDYINFSWEISQWKGLSSAGRYRLMRSPTVMPTRLRTQYRSVIPGSVHREKRIAGSKRTALLVK